MCINIAKIAPVHQLIILAQNGNYSVVFSPQNLLARFVIIFIFDAGKWPFLQILQIDFQDLQDF